MESTLRRRLMEGAANPPRIGEVRPAGDGLFPPVMLVDGEAEPVEPVTLFLRDLALSDMSSLTCRSYAFDLLRWFRFLWAIDVAWETASSAEVAVMVGWMKTARNSQRVTRLGEGRGAVNSKTGKPLPGRGYAPRTINHALSVVSRFYEFHARFGDGPVINPVPTAAGRRSVLAHRNPLEPTPTLRRASLRQRVRTTAPKAMPDALWDELFGVMSCDRDRALICMYVSSGARATELLRIDIDDVDWSRQLVHVVSKGSRLRQPVPVSPESLVFLAKYLAEAGTSGPGEPLWRTRRGEVRPLTYWAMRRILQRANERLGTNWTLHDLRHTAATRLANDPAITLTEVRAILRHADINTTTIYTAVRVDDLFDKLQEHYNRPRQPPHFPPGYDPDDVKVLFGG